MPVWCAILGGNQELMRMKDPGTVDTLKLSAPGLSQEDLAALETPFRTKKIVPGNNEPTTSTRYLEQFTKREKTDTNHVESF